MEVTSFAALLEIPLQLIRCDILGNEGGNRHHRCVRVCVCVRVGGWVGIKEGSRGEVEHEERDGVELDTAKKRER